MKTLNNEIIEGSVDYKPLSVNNAWKGKKYKTQEYDAWRRAIGYLIKYNGRIETNDFIEIEIHFYIINLLKCDVDNFVKPFLDSLVKKQIIKDDRYIVHLDVWKHRSDKDYIKFKIKKHA